MPSHTVATIVGSLRKDSFSKKLANALAKLAPASIKLDVITLEGLSFFNQDLEAAPPADWVAFRERIKKADAVLFVTPEYNRSIPGALKNAIDWASRPWGQNSFHHIPAGVQRMLTRMADLPLAVFAADWTQLASTPLWQALFQTPSVAADPNQNRPWATPSPSATPSA